MTIIQALDGTCDTCGSETELVQNHRYSYAGAAIVFIAGIINAFKY